MPDGPGRRLVADAPGAARLLGRVRRLRDHVGDPQAFAHTRTEPVRRLVVEVIGEPEAGAPGRRLLPVAPRQAFGQAGPGVPEARLSLGVARPVEAPEAGREVDLPSPRCACPLERREQELREGAIAGRHRMVGRLERGVERDPHAARSAVPVAAPPPVVRPASPPSAARPDAAAPPGARGGDGIGGGPPAEQPGELRGEPVGPRDRGEIGPHPALPRGSEPLAQGRVPEEPFESRPRARPGPQVGRGSRSPPSSISSGIAETRVATQGRPWLWASRRTLGRPSRSPSRATRLASTKTSAARSRASSSGRASAPAHSVRCAMPARSASRRRVAMRGPPPTWTKRHAGVSDIRARAAMRSGYPFFSTARPTERIVSTLGSRSAREAEAETPRGRSRAAPVRPCRARGRRARRD